MVFIVFYLSWARVAVSELITKFVILFQKQRLWCVRCGSAACNCMLCHKSARVCIAHPKCWCGLSGAFWSWRWFSCLSMKVYCSHVSTCAFIYIAVLYQNIPQYRIQVECPSTSTCRSYTNLALYFDKFKQWITACRFIRIVACCCLPCD